MEGLPADGPALTETEQEGWAHLGLQPPAQLEPLLEEEPINLAELGEEPAASLTRTLSIVALHLTQNERRWDAQQQHKHSSGRGGQAAPRVT